MKVRYGFGPILAAFLFSMSSGAHAQPDPPAPNPAPQPAPNPAPTGNLPTAADWAAMQDRMRRQDEEIAALRNGGAPKPTPSVPPVPEGSDLNRRVREEREAAAVEAAKTRALETAVAFNLGLPDWIKDNAELLPKDVAAIVTHAQKENYDTQAARAGAVKLAIMDSFFEQQANIDNLTPAQKAALDEFRKLTKTAREDKSADIYASIFEPALETLRRVRKAEEVGRSNAGHARSTDAQKGYAARLVASSEKHYLGAARA